MNAVPTRPERPATTAPGDASTLMVNRMRSLGRRLRFDTGDTVIRQHAPADSVMLIERGLALVEHTDEAGRRSVLALRGHAEIIGEFAVISEAPRTATVRAATELSVTVVSGTAFQRSLRTEPNLAFLLLRRLVLRVNESDRKRVEAGTCSVGHRVARLLVELAELHGTRRHGAVEISRVLSQEQLGSAIGATRESVQRALAVLRADRIVETARRRITILRMDLLLDRAARHP